MTTHLVIAALVYIEAPDQADPEDVATDFGAGFEGAVSSWPGGPNGQLGNVIHAEVDSIRLATVEELDDKGLTE